jgi:hypothetical protein
MSESSTELAAEWGVVELFGHVRLAGRISEVERFGGKMLRLDIPDGDGEFLATQFIGNAALYRVTPTSEETARRVAKLGQPEPVRRWELPAPDADDDEDEDDEEEPF